MAYTPTLKDTLEIEAKNKASQGAYTPTLADTEAIEKARQPQIGNIHSMVGGFVNPFSDIANWGIRGADYLLHASGARPDLIPLIPQIATKPGWARDVGDVAGYLVPFTGALKGVRLAGMGAKALEAGALGSSKLAELAAKAPRTARIAESGAAGAITGAATSPSTKHQLASTVLGGLGGIGGESLAQALAKSGQAVAQLGVPERLRSAFTQQATFSPQQAPMANMLENIADKYISAKNSVTPLYRNVFKDLKDANGKMQAEDLPNYQGEMMRDLSLGRPIPRGVEGVDELTRDFEGSGRPYIDPEETHFLQSRLAALSKSSPLKEDRIAYGKYYKALNQDLKDFLKKGGKLSDYEKANDVFKKTLLPFNKSKIFSRKIKPILDLNTDIVNGEHQLFFGGVNPLARQSSLANEFFPKATEKDLGKMNELSELLGNKNLAREHLRQNMVFNHATTNPQTGQSILNVNNFLKREEKLSPNQRNFLFSPEEQRFMRAMRVSQSKQAKPLTGLAKNIANRAASSYLLHMIFPKWGALAGILGGDAAVKSLSEGAGRFLTRGKTPEELVSRTLDQPEVKGSRVLGGLGSLGGVQFANPEQ